ncbi:ABC transporter substrate-binding protein [Haloechinothrix halophila]|uniref:ABC transporter substrate-binding protein n=1 Tax=Haloechinothrix halophila TaxID=1069073 RepID=UPI00146FAB2C|nr:ABC transporter substrate-binding protein [Haloechinothrix halophila]
MAFSVACGSTVQYSSEFSQSDSSGLPNTVVGEAENPDIQGHDGSIDRSRSARLFPGDETRVDSSTGPFEATEMSERRQFQANENAVDPSKLTGQGVTQSDIFIGYVTANGVQQLGESFGVESNYLGDQEGSARAVAQYINDRGGISGKSIRLVFYDISNDKLFSKSGRSEAAQEACERWTKDKPVFAVVSILTALDDQTLVSCLSTRGVPLIHANQLLRPAEMYARYSPYLYSGHTASLERLIVAFVERLNANEYFDGGWDADISRPGAESTKVGIVARRDVYGQEFRNVTSTELNRSGQDVAAVYEWDGDVSSASSSMNEAVLRFKSASVTHVVSHFNSLAFFATAAEQQNYRPRYSISSDNTPNVLQDIVPDAQLRGSVGIGYAPEFDVDAAQDPGKFSNANSKCRRIMKNAGLDSRTGWDSCDGFGLLVDGLERASKMSTEGLRKGVHSIKSMSTAASFGIGYPNGRFDGGKNIRDLIYRNNCECYQYKSNKNFGI